MPWIACVAGATGLTGRALVEQLRTDANYAQVWVLVRKAGSIRGDDKVREVVTDFEALTDLGVWPLPQTGHVDHVFCCLGTTIAKAGSQAAFTRVDLDYVLALATVAKAHGACHVGVISALGANAQSSVFYNRTKGQMEKAVAALGVDSTHFLRPSLLLGERAERRGAESAAITFAKLVGPVMLGPLRRYRALPADAVASAMRVGARIATTEQVRVTESEQIAALAATA